MPVYGLGEAGRLWFKTISAWLMAQGMKQAKTDPCLFFYRKEGVLRGIITLHVDDKNYCGDKVFDKDIINKMFKKFKFGKIQEGAFKTLGWNVEHDKMEGIIYVSQKDYIQGQLKQINIDQSGMHSTKTPLTEENKKKLRQLIGQLRWLTDQTRPDGCWEELWLSMMASKPTIYEYKMARRLVKRILDNEVKIMYKKLGDENWVISVFTDASVGGLPDEKSSCYGLIIYISNGYEIGQRKDASIISWKSGKVKRIVSQSYDAEVLALSEGLEQALVLKDLLMDMTGCSSEMLTIESFCDNADTIKALAGTKQYKKGNLIGLEVHKIKQMEERGEVKPVRWLPGSYQIADCLTKEKATGIPILESLTKGKFMN